MSAARKAYLTVVPTKEADPWSERELVSGLLARDPRAAVLIWRRFAPRIYGVVSRAMGPGVDAEDITQDVFLRVFSRVHTLKNPDALGSFVLSVALRVIKWQLRQRRVRQIMHLSDDGRAPAALAPGLDPEARQALERFYAILDALPVEERTVFVLRHVEGMDLQEVADAVGKSLATVKRRLGRASAHVEERVRSDGSLAAYSRRTKSDADR
jgi:RNA polymerase sigma-70 factor, ECF subfamily